MITRNESMLIEPPRVRADRGISFLDVEHAGPAGPRVRSLPEGYLTPAGRKRP